MKHLLHKMKHLGALLALITLLLLPGLGWGQQVIGTFPAMDGGFENQNGTLATASSISSAQTTWTTAIAGAGVISNTGGRSGPKYVQYSQTGTSHRRLQSPTSDIPLNSYVVQFFYQGDLDGTTGGDIRGAVSSVGTTSPSYGAYVTDPNTGSVWTKYSATVTTTGTPSFGIGVISTNQTGLFYIDDFVIYAGSAVDESAPSSPGAVNVSNATQTTLDVSWDAASGGVDGGGYLVVRFSSDPGTGNDPNQNGIYAVGNSVPTGGTVRYIGTSTSFTDNDGLSAGTPYWYKVYTVDKAFNYSDESTGTGSTSSGSTPTVASPVPASLSGFSTVTGTASTAQTFTISGTNLTADLVVTAPTDYEVRENETGSYGSSVSFTPSSGTVSEKTIQVRIAASAGVGTPSGNVVCSSTDATSQNVAVSGTVNEPPSITFYFRGPSWMNNNPHDPEIWGPFNEWESAATMTFGDVPGWWSVTVEVADASASIEYQSRFSQDGSTKYQKAFENFSANPTFTTTTGEIWIDASQNNSFYWQGNDFYLLQDKITETQPFAEPDNHVTEFSATANSSTAITITWNDSDATGYLIKGSDVSYAAITAPVDGVEEANAALVRNVSYDNGNWQFTGLTAGTTYYFKIYPYNGTGASVNYKTDGTVPEANATTQEVPSIKWDGGALTTSWSDADNWSGNVVPTAADVVVLDNSLVSGSYSVVLPSGSVKTTILRLTIMPDLPNTITLTLPVENTYGASNDAGFVVGDNTAATDDIIINEGGVLINASGASSGNGIQVNSLSNGTLRINNGGKFIHKTTRSTGGTALAILLSTAAGTETGIYEYDVPGTSSFAIAASGRTYGSLILSRSGGSASYASSGSSPLTVKGDFILNSGVTYTTTMSGALNLGGDLTNNGTALTIASTQAINFNGTATQLISGTNDITFSGAVNITEGSYVSIEEGMSVTVSGSLTNNGSLTLQSNSTTTGSLIHSTAGVPATVERYISGHNNVADAGWHLLGSPVAAFDIDGSSFDPGASDDFYAWQESNSTWMNHKQGTPSQIVPGTGYLVSYETSGTKTFTGALNAADQTVTVTREGAGDYAGFNLIGNPFASAITWGSGWSLGSVGGVAYVWDEATKDYIDIEAGDPIPSANGVMVYLGGEETSQSLTIPAAARIHSSQGWYKSAGGRIVLVANDPDRGAAKRSVIRFNESATEGFDLAWDGYYLRGFAPGFYSVSNGMNYSVNTLPSMNNTLVIPMGFEKTVSSGFSIELQESIPGAVVYLTDKKTGTVTNLTDNGAYHFTAAEGDDANRFTLHFGTLGMDDPSTAAPVHIYAYGGVVYLIGLDAKASVTLTDLTGRVVLAERVNGNGLAMLNAAKLPKGVYVVTAVAGSRVVSAKVIL